MPRARSNSSSKTRGNAKSKSPARTVVSNRTTPHGMFERSLRITRLELEKLWRHLQANPNDLRRTRWYSEQAESAKAVRLLLALLLARTKDDKFLASGPRVGWVWRWRRATIARDNFDFL